MYFKTSKNNVVNFRSMDEKYVISDAFVVTRKEDLLQIVRILKSLNFY